VEEFFHELLEVYDGLEQQVFAVCVCVCVCVCVRARARLSLSLCPSLRNKICSCEATYHSSVP